jgi:hypothetical protein
MLFYRLVECEMWVPRPNYRQPSKIFCAVIMRRRNHQRKGQEQKTTVEMHNIVLPVIHVCHSWRESWRLQRHNNGLHVPRHTSVCILWIAPKWTQISLSYGIHWIDFAPSYKCSIFWSLHIIGFCIGIRSVQCGLKYQYFMEDTIFLLAVMYLLSVLLYHIHTTWIWSLVTQPNAGGFAPASPKPWRAKGRHSASILIIICYRQKPIKVSYLTFILLNILWFLAKFAVPVIALPPPVSADRKTGFNVGLTRQPRSGGTALHGMRVTSPTSVGSETNKWWIAALR